MEASFRVAVLVLMASAIAVALYHRIQAAKTGEKFDRRQEGLLLAIVLRLAGLGMWLGTILYIVSPGAIEWTALMLPEWLRWAGAVLGAIGVAGMYWTLTNLGKNLTDTVTTRDAATMVTSGPYRFIRHPFYATVALLMAGVTLLSANWFIGLCGLLVISLLTVRCDAEERKLIEKFGEPYRQYMARTGRYLPRIGARRAAPS